MQDFRTPMKHVNLALVLTVLLFPVGHAYAADARLAEAAMHGDKSAVQSLVRQKADLNAPLADGTTALHWAVRADDLETAGLLIRSGANISAADHDGVTPFSLASSNANAAMIKKLLAAGADANASDPNGETPLMTVARTGETEPLKVLLDA